MNKKIIVLFLTFLTLKSFSSELKNQAMFSFYKRGFGASFVQRPNENVSLFLSLYKPSDLKLKGNGDRHFGGKFSFSRDSNFGVVLGQGFSVEKGLYDDVTSNTSSVFSRDYLKGELIPMVDTVNHLSVVNSGEGQKSHYGLSGFSLKGNSGTSGIAAQYAYKDEDKIGAGVALKMRDGVGDAEEFSTASAWFNFSLGKKVKVRVSADMRKNPRYALSGSNIAFKREQPKSLGSFTQQRLLLQRQRQVGEVDTYWKSDQSSNADLTLLLREYFDKESFGDRSILETSDVLLLETGRSGRCVAFDESSNAFSVRNCDDFEGNQWWKVREDANGNKRVTHVLSGKCLSITSGGAQVNDCSGVSDSLVETGLRQIGTDGGHYLSLNEIGEITSTASEEEAPDFYLRKVIVYTGVKGFALHEDEKIIKKLIHLIFLI